MSKNCTNFVNRWDTLKPEELERILDAAFKAVARRILEQRSED